MTNKTCGSCGAGEYSEKFPHEPDGTCLNCGENFHEPHITFEEAAGPLIKWLNDNMNPHYTIVVTNTSAVLSSDEICFNTDQYLKD